MLRIHSFLQGIYGYIKALTKRMYRTCAIITTGAAVIAVIAFSSQCFGGSGKNRVTTVYPSMEAESEASENEEVEADTEAKIQTEAVLDNAEVQSIEENCCEESAVVESVVPRDAAIVTLTGSRENEAEETVEATEAGETEETAKYSVTEYEYDILLHIVSAEARGCDLKGQILVANVILNRVANEAFPDSIEGVVFQKNQFSPVVNNILWDAPVTDSVREAVDCALAGEDYSEGALFFSARARMNGNSMTWFDTNLRWLFEHDGHEFYTFR